MTLVPSLKLGTDYEAFNFLRWICHRIDIKQKRKKGHPVVLRSADGETMLKCAQSSSKNQNYLRLQLDYPECDSHTACSFMVTRENSSTVNVTSSTLWWYLAMGEDRRKRWTVSSPEVNRYRVQKSETCSSLPD
jgi:hypothetical protein